MWPLAEVFQDTGIPTGMTVMEARGTLFALLCGKWKSNASMLWTLLPLSDKIWFIHIWNVIKYTFGEAQRNENYSKMVSGFSAMYEGCNARIHTGVDGQIAPCCHLHTSNLPPKLAAARGFYIVLDWGKMSQMFSHILVDLSQILVTSQKGLQGFLQVLCKTALTALNTILYQNFMVRFLMQVW